MEGTRSRFIVTLTIALLFSMNVLAMSIVAQQEGNLEIVVDSTSKEVSPGEDAVFHWTAYNNDTFTTYDLSVSHPGTEFSESSFTLGPGESHSVTQTATTSINDQNNTQYSHPYRWDATWHGLLTSGQAIVANGAISVIVINYTDNGQNGEEGGKDNNSTPGFEPAFLIVAILITLIILRRKRMSSID